MMVDNNVRISVFSEPAYPVSLTPCFSWVWRVNPANLTVLTVFRTRTAAACRRRKILHAHGDKVVRPFASKHNGMISSAESLSPLVWPQRAVLRRQEK